MVLKNKSQYSASFTGCALMHSEFNSVLSLLMSPDIKANLKKEVVERSHLQVNTEIAAQRVLSEFKKRYKSMPESFWQWYITLNQQASKAALFYVLLKTYRLLFEFHTNVTIKKWNSAERTISRNDILVEYYNISANDEFVESWSKKTRNKLISSYQTIMVQVGLLDRSTSMLKPIKLDAHSFSWYVKHGDIWFLEACLLYPYEIENIKNELL